MRGKKRGTKKFWILEQTQGGRGFCGMFFAILENFRGDFRRKGGGFANKSVVPFPMRGVACMRVLAAAQSGARGYRAPTHISFRDCPVRSPYHSRPTLRLSTQFPKNGAKPPPLTFRPRNLGFFAPRGGGFAKQLVVTFPAGWAGPGLPGRPGRPGRPGLPGRPRRGGSPPPPPVTPWTS